MMKKAKKGKTLEKYDTWVDRNGTYPLIVNIVQFLVQVDLEVKVFITSKTYLFSFIDTV